MSSIIEIRAIQLIFRRGEEVLPNLVSGCACGVRNPNFRQSILQILELRKSDQIDLKIYSIQANSPSLGIIYSRINGVVTNPREGCGGGRFYLFCTV